MIAETRSYIKTQINSVDFDLKQIDDPFGTIDIDEKKVVSGYKIIFKPTGLEETGNHVLEVFPVDIEFYRKVKNRDLTDDFDILFDKVITIRDKIANITDVKNNINFFRVTPISFVPEDLELNQRIVKITININFERATAFC